MSDTRLLTERTGMIYHGADEEWSSEGEDDESASNESHDEMACAAIGACEEDGWDDW